MRKGIDGELVEGTKRTVRVLPLLAPVPRCQHHQGETRRPLRRRTETAAADPRLHAAREGVRLTRVAGA